MPIETYLFPAVGDEGKEPAGWNFRTHRCGQSRHCCICLQEIDVPGDDFLIVLTGESPKREENVMGEELLYGREGGTTRHAGARAYSDPMPLMPLGSVPLRQAAQEQGCKHLRACASHVIQRDIVKRFAQFQLANDRVFPVL